MKSLKSISDQCILYKQTCKGILRKTGLIYTCQFGEVYQIYLKCFFWKTCPSHLIAAGGENKIWKGGGFNVEKSLMILIYFLEFRSTCLVGDSLSFCKGQSTCSTEKLTSERLSHSCSGRCYLIGKVLIYISHLFGIAVGLIVKGILGMMDNTGREEGRLVPIF